MRFLQALLSSLVTIVRTIAYEWLLALCALWRRLAGACRRASAAKRIPVRERRAARGQCTPVRDIAFKKPDPLLYSQPYLMSQGLVVTWDNPDIALYRNGALVPSSQLASDTEYEIVARIWNNSTDAPVAMLPVVFSYLSFGIATLSHPIASDTVNLGVKGGPNHPAFARVKWRTPTAAGHYCIQVFLDWFDTQTRTTTLARKIRSSARRIRRPISSLSFATTQRSASFTASRLTLIACRESPTAIRESAPRVVAFRNNTTAKTSLSRRVGGLKSIRHIRCWRQQKKNRSRLESRHPRASREIRAST